MLTQLGGMGVLHDDSVYTHHKTMQALSPNCAKNPPNSRQENDSLVAIRRPL
jgi:hypothetical protein